MSNALVVQAYGYVFRDAGGVGAATWVVGGSAADGVGAGQTNITLERACDPANSLVFISGKTGETFSLHTGSHTTDTNLLITNFAAGGAAADNLSFDFIMYRKPGT